MLLTALALILRLGSVHLMVWRRFNLDLILKVRELSMD